jgi:ribosomal protein S18 acetylase RimI-like enzyme
MGKGSRFVYVGTVCRTDGLVGGRSVGRDGGGRSDARAMGWDGTGRGADRFDVAREGSDVGGDGDGGGRMGGGFASSVLDRANARESAVMIEKMVAIAARALEARRRETAGGGEGTTRECEYEYRASAREMEDEDREWCFDVTKGNMMEVYERTWGWDATEKRRELNNGAARFVLARDAKTRAPVAFVHFRFEKEDEDVDAPVGYVYELQCEPTHQRRALGETLVKIVETVSKRLGMDAVVLTVLKENVGAYKFYTEKMGYGVDALSPDDGPEGGSSHYLILSKRFE